MAYGQDLRYVPATDNPFSEHKMFMQLLAPFEPKRSAIVYRGEKQLIGVVGEYKNSIKKALKLPEFCAGFEVFLSGASDGTNTYVPVSRFPKVEQDITLKVPARVSFGEVEQCLKNHLFAQENSTVNIVPVSIFQKADDADYRQISFRIIMSSYERTLTAVEVNNLLDTVATKAKALLQAERV